MGRLLLGADLRGTQCDRFGNGDLMLVGYGDSSGGYAFSPKNQDAAIAPSLRSAVLSNIANALPRLTEVQDMAGKWIDSITLHALDEFVEQVQPQSFIANTLRIFAGGQKGYTGDGTGNRNIRNTFTLLAEIPIQALTRVDIPRSFNVKACVYIPPAQNIYLGLAIPQPYTCSFEMWDLQANTQIGDGISSSIGGSSSVGNGNDLSEDITEPSTDTNFVLPITFTSATWIVGEGATGSPSGSGGSGGTGTFPSGSPSPPPPSTTPPPTPTPTPTGGGGGGSSVSVNSPSKDPSSTPSDGSGSPTSATPSPKPAVSPPSEGGCVPVQDCNWHPISAAQSATIPNGGLSNATGLCPKGTIARGVVDFETSGSFVLCCTPSGYPPNDLGCSGIPATTWSCTSGGICVLDASGIYPSQAACEAALVPAPFTGGQCATPYAIVFFQTYANGNTRYYVGSGSASSGQSTPPTPTQLRDSFNTSGAVSSITWSGAGLTFFGQINVVVNGSQNLLISNVENTSPATGFGVFAVTRRDGLPDTCGNPPPTCP